MITHALPRPRLFKKSLIPVIVQDVLDACKSLQAPPKGEKRPEEDLSKQVYRQLLRIPRYTFGPLEPHIESCLPDLESRADIRFSCGAGIHTYFIFEAKRLFVTHPGGKSATLVTEYIHEGMMRFVVGRYAPNQQASAMLGYVFGVTVIEAKSKVSLAIESERAKLCLKNGYKASTLPVTPPVDETHHDVQGKPFTLYHLYAAVPPATTAK